MKFDISSARSAGYSDDEIADYLATEKQFDLGAALSSGYSASEVVDFLSKAQSSGKQDLPADVTPSEGRSGTPMGQADPRLIKPEEPGIIKRTADFLKPAPKSVLENYKPSEQDLQADRDRRLSYGAGPINSGIEAAADAVRGGQSQTDSPTVKKVAAAMQQQNTRSFKDLTAAAKNPENQRGARNTKADEYRNAGEWSVDTLSSLAQGFTGLVQMPVNIIAPSSEVAGYLRSAQKELQDGESDVLKANRERLKERVLSEDGFFAKYAATVKELVTNPTITISEAAKQIPNFLGVVAAARLVGAASAGAVGLAGRASPTVALGEAISGGAIQAAARAAGTIAGGVGASMVMAGGDAAGNVYERLTSKDPQVVAAWKQNPEYQELVAGGKAPDQAIEELATAKARMAALITAPLGLLGFAGAEAAVAGRGLGKVASEAMTAKGVAKMFGKELGGEQLEEGGTQLGGNIITKTVDQNQSLTEGVPEAMGTAMVTSAPFAAVGARSQYKEAQAGSQSFAGDGRAAGFLLDPQSYDPRLMDGGQSLRGAADVGPSAQPRMANFTEPGSATDQAGLTPIVVPLSTNSEIPDVSTPGGIGAATAVGGFAGSPEFGGGLDLAGLGQPGAGGGARGNASLDAGATGQNVAAGAGAVQQPAGLSRPFDRATDADLLARTEAAIAGSENNNAVAQPVEQSVGRKGDGYVTEGDAQQALPGRQRIFPALDWTVEQMPSGKFRLAGYATEAASQQAAATAAAPTPAAPAVEATAPILAPSGTPFSTEKTAAVYAQQNGITGYSTVKMDGGWAINPALETTDGTTTTQAQQSPAQGQEGAAPATAVAGTTVPSLGDADLAATGRPALPADQPLRLALPATVQTFKSVRASLQQQSNLSVAMVPTSEWGDSQKLGAAVARLLGKTYTVYRYDSGNRDAMPNGLVDKLSGKNIMVAEDTDDAPIFVAFHEGFHALPKPIREKAEGALRNLFRSENMADFRREFGLEGASDALLNAEIPAYMAQAVVRRPDFLNELKDKLGNREFAEFAKVILGKLNQILTGARKEYGDDFVSKYISDIDQARGILSDAYAQAMQEQGLQPDMDAAGASPVMSNRSRTDLNFKDVIKRTPELQAAAQDVKDGKMSAAQYEALVNEVNEVKPVEAYKTVPAPASDGDIRNVLSSDKTDRIGAPSRDLKAGAPVGLRLDIPADANRGTWVVSVHEQEAGYNAGKSIGYEPVAAATNASFGVVEKAAINIAGGKPKATIAVIKGAWKPTTAKQAQVAAQAALKSKSWVQVGMDPERHSYFYDRATMEPVVSADEVLQVGPLVLAKNPKYGNKSDFMFSNRAKKAGDFSYSQDDKGHITFGVEAERVRFIANKFAKPSVLPDGAIRFKAEDASAVIKALKAAPKINPQIATDIQSQLGLSEEELGSTSLEYQTGEPKQRAFVAPLKGGIPAVVKFLEDRRRASGLRVLNIANPADQDTLARLMAAETLAAIRSNGNALEWYDETIAKTLAMAAVKYPELGNEPNAQMLFRVAMAITSQGLNVENNLKITMRQYDAFRNDGKFPEVGEGDSAAVMQKSFRVINGLLDEIGPDLLRRFLVTEFTIGELNRAGFDPSGELVDEKVLGSSILGPKIGFGFYSNLNGNFEPVTMDMWFMRTMGRLTGNLRAFDAEKFGTQVKRLRAALDIRGEDGVFGDRFDPDLVERARTDNDAAIELARQVGKAHEKDYKANRAEYDADTRKKSELVFAADTMIISVDKPNDAPTSGTERRLLREVVRKAVAEVENAYGQRIPPAAMQALIWYPEQELYKAMGVKLSVTSQDYAGATEKVLTEEGYDGKRLRAAAKSGSARVRQAAARNVGRGSEVDGQEDGGTGPLKGADREQFIRERYERTQLEQEQVDPKRKGIVFEVAPDPNNVELTDRWRSLTQAQRVQISNRVAREVVRKVLDQFNTDGIVALQVGSYLDDTNPSFSLLINKGDPVEISKFLGFVLAQDSMMVISPKEFKGSAKVGAVSIRVGDKTPAEIEQIYQQLRTIEINGEKPIGGQSYANGTMTVLNYSGVPTPELAILADQKLNKAYNVLTRDVFAAFPEKKDYDYASQTNDGRGSRGDLRQRARALRAEATSAVERELESSGLSFSKRAQPGQGGQDQVTPGIGDKLQARVDGEFDALVSEYAALPGTKDGRLLDVDIARELSPEYRDDRSRAAEIHEAASNFIDRLFEDRVANGPQGGIVAYQGYEKAEVPRVQAARKLAGLVKRLEEGTLSQPAFELQVRLLSERMSEVSATKDANRIVSTRERGADIIREKLIAARRRGDVDFDTTAFALWALQQNPAIAEGLGISVRERPENQAGAAGDYNPAASIMRVFKGVENRDTAVHEILHHTERMMPAVVQDGIRKEWAKQYAKTLAKSSGKTLDALAMFPAAMVGDKLAQAAVSDGFSSGALDVDTHYQLTNPSEFWAVNASAILSGRYEAGSWVGKAKQWVGEMLQKVKGILGMRSDAAVLKGLEAVLNGDGKRLSNKMLTDMVRLNDRSNQADQTDTPSFKQWFGDSKVVDADGKPLVVYHGTYVRETLLADGTVMGDIKAFDRMITTQFRSPSIDTVGSWFSTNPGEGGAEMYGNTIYPVYLSIKNPQVTTFQLMTRRARLLENGKDDGRKIGQAEVDAYREWLGSMDKDGIKIEGSGNSGSTEFDNQVAWIALEPTQIKSAIGNNGEFDPESADIRLSKRQRLVGTNFDMESSNRRDAARIVIQDDALRMKRVIESVKKQGGNVGEAQNFYDANTLMPGRIQAAVDDFKNEVVRPMLDKAGEYGINMDELSMYAYAKHAKERNAYIASINKRLRDGGSGMTNAEADAIIQMVAITGDTAKFEELHQMLMGITSTTRNRMLSEGLITQDEFDAMTNAYDNYIPLRGFEDVEEETGVARPGIGRGVNVRGGETIRALGRSSKAGDLIENALRDYERAISRIEKNDVAKVLLDFVLSNPDPALWGVDVERTKPGFNKAQGTVQYTKSIEKGEDTIGVKVGGQQVYIKFADNELTRALRQTWKDEVSGAERVTLAITGWWNNWLRAVLTKYNPAFAAINIPRDALWSGTASALDELGVKGLGLYFKNYGKALMASGRQELGVSGTTSMFGNPQMDRMFKEFRASGGITGGFYMRSLKDINEDLRDELLLAGASARNPIEMIKSLPPYKLAKMTLKGLQLMGAASENATRFALYMASREMGNSPAKAAILAKDGTTNFNRKGEWGGALNNLYLFFNAGVQGTSQLLKVMKNPKVQAAMAGVTGIGMMLALYGAAAGGEDDDGEAYWDKIPGYVKERNLVVMLPPGDALAGGIERAGKRGRYFLIPVQYGFNFFPNAGYMMADVIRNRQDPKRGVTPTKAALHMASTTLGSVNPFGGSVDLTDGVQVLLAVMPTLADLPVQLVNERNTFGTTSAPGKSPFDKRPDSERMFTSQQDTVSAKIAKTINEMGGGNEGKAGKILGMETAVTPGTIDTLIKATTGGLGTFVEQVGTSVMAMTGDNKNLKANKLPFVNRFYGEVDESANIRTAGERMAEVRKLADEVKAQQKIGLDPELKDEEKKLMSLAGMQDTYSKQQSLMRKAELQIIKDKSLTEAEKRLQRQRIQVDRDKLSTEMNKAYLQVAK